MSTTFKGTKSSGLLATLAAFIALVAGVAFAASAPNPVGDWQGTVNGGASSLRIVLHIAEAKDGSLTGTLDSPDQGANGIKLSSVSYHAPDVKFEISTISAAFEGKLGNNQIAGNWKQLGQSFPVTFKPVK